MFNNRSQISSIKNTTTCVVLRGDTKDVQYRFQEDTLQMDQALLGTTVRALKKWWRKTPATVTYDPATVLQSSRRPTWRQSQLEFDKFFDYHGEVPLPSLHLDWPSHAARNLQTGSRGTVS